MGDAQQRDGGAFLAQQFESLAQSFVRERNVNLTMLLEFGSKPLRVHISKGRVVSVEATWPPLASWDFSVRGSEKTWKRFWRALPAPGSHDIFALVRTGDLHIDGNLYPFMCNLQYIKDLLSIGRKEGI